MAIAGIAVEIAMGPGQVKENISTAFVDGLCRSLRRVAGVEIVQLAQHDETKFTRIAQAHAGVGPDIP